MHALVARLAAAVLVTVAAGCAAPQTEALLQNRAATDLPPRAMIDGVPFIAQEDMYCGPAALAMALGATGPAVDQDTVAEAIYTPGREGTLRSDVLAGARRWERVATPVASLDALLREVAAGNPVIVFQNLSLAIAPVWHFAVAIGYDLDSPEIVLHSGTTAKARTDLATFERTWARGDYWGLAVAPPDRLPVTAAEVEAMGAAAALERLAHLDAAAKAWRATVERWPDSFGGYMGLGNTHFARQDYAAARAAYRRAVEIRPESAPAWNNLAYALFRQGHRKAAVEAAENAVRYGGDDPNYRATLQEILAAATT